jgi:hypothetical protein
LAEKNDESTISICSTINNSINRLDNINVQWRPRLYETSRKIKTNIATKGGINIYTCGSAIQWLGDWGRRQIVYLFYQYHRPTIICLTSHRKGKRNLSRKICTFLYNVRRRQLRLSKRRKFILDKYPIILTVTLISIFLFFK